MSKGLGTETVRMWEHGEPRADVHVAGAEDGVPEAGRRRCCREQQGSDQAKPWVLRWESWTGTRVTAEYGLCWVVLE